MRVGHPRHYPSLAPALRGVDNAFLPWSPVTADDTGEAVAETPIPEGWRLRRGVWNLLVRFKFQQAKPFVVPIPSDQPPLTAVPFSQGYPDIPIAGLVVADHVPRDEENLAAFMLFMRFQSWLHRVFPPQVAGLPPIDADPRKALDAAYPAAEAAVPATLAATGVRRPRPRRCRRRQSVRVLRHARTPAGPSSGTWPVSTASSATPGSVHRPPASSSSSTNVPVGYAP